jgi:hypothetical protein
MFLDKIADAVLRTIGAKVATVEFPFEEWNSFWVTYTHQQAGQINTANSVYSQFLHDSIHGVSTSLPEDSVGNVSFPPLLEACTVVLAVVYGSQRTIVVLRPQLLSPQLSGVRGPGLRFCCRARHVSTLSRRGMSWLQLRCLLSTEQPIEDSHS